MVADGAGVGATCDSPFVAAQLKPAPSAPQWSIVISYAKKQVGPEMAGLFFKFGA